MWMYIRANGVFLVMAFTSTMDILVKVFHVTALIKAGIFIRTTTIYTGASL